MCINRAACQKNFRAESRFALALELDVVEVPCIFIALPEVESRAVKFNLVNGGNGVTCQGEDFQINPSLVDAGDKFVLLIKNFRAVNNQVAVFIPMKNVPLINVNTADFNGHAQNCSLFIKNFQVIDDQVSVFVAVKDIQLIQVDTADFYGHAERFGNFFCDVRQKFFDHFRPI